MRKDSTLGLNPESLARLLGIALYFDSDEDKDSSTHPTAQLLKARLAGTLPLDTTVVEELPAILGQLRKNLMPLGGRTLGEIITDSKSDLGAIKKIRRYAKKMASRKRSEADRAVAVAIYYAAIASALVFHDMKITTHSYESLEVSFAKLINKPWMSTELNKLFVRALKLCRRRAINQNHDNR
jgi:hypothetical protein